MRGKPVTLYLMDGVLNGRIKCSLPNWTGEVYRIPRVDLEKCEGRAALSQSGVYLLIGFSEPENKHHAYVGQAGVRANGEGILCRLREHRRDRGPESVFYWNEAVVFTTSNNSFGPTEMSFLENRFCVMAREAGRYRVENAIIPTPGNLTEEKESELEEFIDYAMIAVGLLGHKLFEKIRATEGVVPPTEGSVPPAVEVSSNSAGLALILRHTNRGSGQVNEATGMRTAEGFVVLKGSRIAQEQDEYASIPPWLKEARAKADKDAEGFLREDVLFGSPSSAASFVVGGQRNGLIMWKTADGRSLAEIEDSPRPV